MAMMAAIFGLSGLKLTAKERAFFKAAKPWGFILFARNVDTPDQVRALCDDLRSCVGRDAMIFTDQEGGRVRRFRPPHWPDYPAASALVNIHNANAKDELRACYLHHRLMADDLRAVGVTADCAPVLDIPVVGADPIISDRAFGRNPSQVIDMAHAAMAGLMSGGVAPVIKHIPGHGRATVDSHLELPRISTPLAELEQTDFVPFKALREAPMAMTAHAVFDCADDKAAVTVSPKALTSLIRENIGYDGLLMSDDLDMKALSGTLKSRTQKAFKAGCDIALQCSGNLAAMEEVASGAVNLSGASLARAVIADNCAGVPTEFDRTAADAEYRALLSGGGMV